LSLKSVRKEEEENNLEDQLYAASQIRGKEKNFYRKMLHKTLNAFFSKLNFSNWPETTSIELHQFI